jgi:hypothetical protein
MPAFVYDNAEYMQQIGTLNMSTDTMKWMLVTNAYAAAKSDQFVSAASSNEISATGYTGGFNGASRLSAPRTIVNDTSANIVRTVFSGNAVWSALGGASNATIAAAVLIKEITNDGASILVGYFPIGTTLTGTTASSSPTVTGLSTTIGISVGMAVSGTGITGGTTVSAIVSGTSVTLSGNATASGSTSLTFGTPITTNGSGITLTVDGSNGNLTAIL